jgi:hypothetical protein
MKHRLWTVLIAGTLVASAALSPATPSAQAALPARFQRYLDIDVRPSASERRQLLAGGPVIRLLEADASKEVAVFGAVWIAADPARYLALQQDIETFEQSGGYRITKRISSPPTAEDFAEVRLPDEDIRDLSDCRVGDCIVKLGQASIDAIRARVDFRSPTAGREASAVFREQLLRFVTGYLQQGNAGLAVYRDAERPTFVAAEFADMIARMPTLTELLPDVRHYLLGYPAATLSGATDFLYWQEVDFGLRPTIRVSHLVIYPGAAETVVASKMLYASHYFWTGLELRVLVPDPARGPGFWFITVNRSRSDGLSGFRGFFVRRRVRAVVEQGVLNGLTKTKSRLEEGR